MQNVDNNKDNLDKIHFLKYQGPFTNVEDLYDKLHLGDVNLYFHSFIDFKIVMVLSKCTVHTENQLGKYIVKVF